MVMVSGPNSSSKPWCLRKTAKWCEQNETIIRMLIIIISLALGTVRPCNLAAWEACLGFWSTFCPRKVVAGKRVGHCNINPFIAFHNCVGAGAKRRRPSNFQTQWTNWHCSDLSFFPQRLSSGRMCFKNRGKPPKQLHCKALPSQGVRIWLLVAFL